MFETELLNEGLLTNSEDVECSRLGVERRLAQKNGFLNARNLAVNRE